MIWCGYPTKLCGPYRVSTHSGRQYLGKQTSEWSSAQKRISILLYLFFFIYFFLHSSRFSIVFVSFFFFIFLTNSPWRTAFRRSFCSKFSRYFKIRRIGWVFLVWHWHWSLVCRSMFVRPTGDRLTCSVTVQNNLRKSFIWLVGHYKRLPRFTISRWYTFLGWMSDAIRCICTTLQTFEMIFVTLTFVSFQFDLSVIVGKGLEIIAPAIPLNFSLIIAVLRGVFVVVL